MQFIDETRQVLLAWLASPEAWLARHALESTGIAPDVTRQWLHEVTEDPGSAARIVSLVADARSRRSNAQDTVSVEQWLLVRQALDALSSPAMATIGDSALAANVQ